MAATIYLVVYDVFSSPNKKLILNNICFVVVTGSTSGIGKALVHEVSDSSCVSKTNFGNKTVNVML